MGFIGLPPEGAHPSTPATGELVLDLQGSDTEGLNIDLNVYADGRMIWQTSVVVPGGANQNYSGYLERRLTTEGVELLRSRILSSGLFEHNLRLDPAGWHHDELAIRVRKGDRIVSVEAHKDRPWHPEADVTKETPVQARALVRLQALLADPEAWLPTRAWADREIRAYVASRYLAVFDRRKPSPSELPPPADELLLDNCQVVTTEEARAISKALEDSGISPSPNAEVLAYVIGGTSYLHFHPALPDQRPC